MLKASDRPSRKRPLLQALSSALALALAAIHQPKPAKAHDCTPPSGLSSCVDADTLWLTADTNRFVGIPAAAIEPSRPLRVGTALSYLSRPVILTAPSPEPEGREIAVVDHAYQLTWLYSHAIGRRVVLSAALPTSINQSGAGLEGVTSQAGRPLPATALRDPRLSVGLVLLELKRGRLRGLRAQSRLGLALPLGQEDRLAGGRSATLAPTLVLELCRSNFCAASELGVRLRQTSELGGARVGSQALSSLGLSIDLLRPARLSLVAETWMLPTLVSQTPAPGLHEPTTEATLVPSEWLMSVRSVPFRSGEWAVQLGAGSGIPLSTERRAGEPTEQFMGVTTPALRVVATIKYAPALGPSRDTQPARR